VSNRFLRVRCVAKHVSRRDQSQRAICDVARVMPYIVLVSLVTDSTTCL
jgi:hypothetical protein